MRNRPTSSARTSGDYVAAVNRAIDHILAHLDRPLRLEEVARVACFSPFHFHRVFRALLGEPLNQFIRRLRLERAVRMLAHGRPASLTQVALACGFSSSSDFSRSFRQRYGRPPSGFDVERFRAERRAEWTSAITDPGERHRLRGLPPGDNPDAFAIELRRLPPRRVAYLRVLAPYRPGVVNAAATRLVAWARERGCVDGQWLGYMLDDPDLVAHADCRYDVGVVAAGIAPAGEVGVIAFPAMRVAELEIRGPIDPEMRALDWLYGTWLPASGYVPTDQPCFEAWLGLPFAHGLEHFELRLQLPVAPG